MRKQLNIIMILAWLVGAPAAFAETTTLQGFNLSTMDVQLSVPDGMLVLPLKKRMTDLLASKLGWTQPANPATTLVLNLSTDAEHSGAPGKVVEAWFMHLWEGPVLVRGFSFNVLTYDIHEGPLVRTPPTQAEIETAVDQYTVRFIRAYQLGNGLAIMPFPGPVPSGPSLTLNGNGAAITVARGATITTGVTGSVSQVAISPYVWPDCLTLTSVNDTEHLGFAWAAPTVSFTAPATQGAYAVRYWQGCSTQTAISQTVTVQ